MAPSYLGRKYPAHVSLALGGTLETDSSNGLGLAEGPTGIRQACHVAG